MATLEGVSNPRISDLSGDSSRGRNETGTFDQAGSGVAGRGPTSIRGGPPSTGIVYSPDRQKYTLRLSAANSGLSSGPLLSTPSSNNSLGTYLPGYGTRQFRNPDVPLYLKDINCHGCFDPTVDTVLNPAAWTDQAAGVFGTGAVYYNDFRGKRRPVESMSFGKSFPIKGFPFLGERTSFSIRAEFFNLFDEAGVAYPKARWTWADFVQTAKALLLEIPISKEEMTNG